MPSNLALFFNLLSNLSLIFNISSLIEGYPTPHSTIFPVFHLDVVSLLPGETEEYHLRSHISFQPLSLKWSSRRSTSYPCSHLENLVEVYIPYQPVSWCHNYRFSVHCLEFILRRNYTCSRRGFTLLHFRCFFFKSPYKIPPLKNYISV